MNVSVTFDVRNVHPRTILDLGRIAISARMQVVQKVPDRRVLETHNCPIVTKIVSLEHQRTDLTQ